MKIKIHRLAAALVGLTTITGPVTTVFAQGSLTPPGAPAPTMKTLTQIEPRTPISSAPYLINASGSYYLTTNLTVSGGDAITIAVDDVTLDLRGFTIYSTAPSATGNGIQIGAGNPTNGPSNIAILNGFIRGGVTNNGSGVYSGSGFGSGIGGYPMQNARVSEVSVLGCRDSGIFLGYGNSTLVEACTVQTVGYNGIVAATIKASVAKDCGNNGVFGNTAADCRGESTGSGYGLYANLAENCYGYSTSGEGLHANTAQNCEGGSITGTALFATTANTCYGYSRSGTALYAFRIAIACYGWSGSGTGLDAYIANSCYGWSTNGTGLLAHIANSCYGSSHEGLGLWATAAQNCEGYSTSATGLKAPNAENCYGGSTSGEGLQANTAQNCEGDSSSGTGLQAAFVANSCRGHSTSGTGLTAYIANSCIGASDSGTAQSISFKYNMP